MLMKSSNDSVKSDNFLLNLSRGNYGITKTLYHLVFSIILIFLITYFSSTAGWNNFLTSISVFAYGIYIANVGIGLWRLSRKIKQEIGNFFTKALSALSVLFGLSAIFNALKMLFLSI